jgi:hypothetical protein
MAGLAAHVRDIRELFLTACGSSTSGGTARFSKWQPDPVEMYISAISAT